VVFSALFSLLLLLTVLLLDFSKKFIFFPESPPLTIGGVPFVSPALGPLCTAEHRVALLNGCGTLVLLTSLFVLSKGRCFSAPNFPLRLNILSPFPWAYLLRVSFHTLRDSPLFPNRSSLYFFSVFFFPDGNAGSRR